MPLNDTCAEHDWVWDPSDAYGCPVCHGVSLERNRILEVIAAQVCVCSFDCKRIDMYVPELIARILEPYIPQVTELVSKNNTTENSDTPDFPFEYEGWND